MSIKNKKVRFIVDSLLIIVGTFLMGFAFNIFLVPNNISPSGFSGLSRIIGVLIERGTGHQIETSILYLIMNAVLYLFAFKFLGKRFAVTAGIGIGAYTLFIQFANFNIFKSNDLLLCAIYGGILMGVGLGLVLRGRGSTGGSDLLACIINKKNPAISFGTTVFAVNCVVVGLSILTYGIEYSLYSLISIWLMSKIADIVVAGVKGLQAYYIISSNNKQIADRIMKEIHRGVTSVKVCGMYSHSKHDMLMVLLNKGQVVELKNIVADEDSNAFMFSAPVTEALGKNFLPLKKKNPIIYFHKKRVKNYKANKALRFKYDATKKCETKRKKNVKNIKKIVKKAP